jgi:hypothetical protein
MSALTPSVATTRAWLERARASTARGAATVERWPVPAVLGGLVAVEWACVLALARTVRHAGWIYYQGGDQLWYYTLGWLLGHGELGKAAVGDGWPVVLAPIARIAGPNLVSALPAIILLNVLVLLPVAMLALYGIAARIGGRLFGYWAVVVWIAVPFVGIAYTNMGYHQKYTELLLPQALGLTALADFPTTVAALVATYFCARVVLDDQPQLIDGAAAGLAAGVAISIKPSTALFLLGPALAFVFKRRFAHLGMFVVALAPALTALAVWKERGLGRLPVFGSAFAPQPLAIGHDGAGPIVAFTLHRYLTELNWSHLGHNLDQLREHFWSGRVLQWLVVAGLIGLARQSRPAALLVGGSFAAFVIVKGSYAYASVDDGSTFRVLMPAFPAFVLFLASVPLLFPHAPRWLRPWRPAFDGPQPHVRRALALSTVVLSGIVPLGAFAAASTTGGSAEAALLSSGTMPVPANIDLGLRAQASRGRVALTWRPMNSVGGPVLYHVWRGPASQGDGLTCPPEPGGRTCLLQLPEVAITRDPNYGNTEPKGRWVFRIAIAANWLNDPHFGDVYLVSKPVEVVVP